MQNLVELFHTNFGHPKCDKPTLPDIDRVIIRQGWTIEESFEAIYALCDTEEEFAKAYDSLVNMFNVGYRKCLEKGFKKNTDKDKIVNYADAIADKAYFTYGDAVESGIDLDSIINIVHSSNMSKGCIIDGKFSVTYDENGKIKKGNMFYPPEPAIKEKLFGLNLL